jgi:hypothetical protein
MAPFKIFVFNKSKKKKSKTPSKGQLSLSSRLTSGDGGQAFGIHDLIVRQAAVIMSKRQGTSNGGH